MEQTHDILSIWQNCDDFCNRCFVGAKGIAESWKQTNCKNVKELNLESCTSLQHF